MNNVSLIGRMTKDPEVRQGESTSVVRFSIALDRGKDKDGNDRGADFPNILAFGKTAENIGKYLSKGKLVGVSGHIQTGSYENKDGKKVYTTDVVADRIFFLEKSNNGNGSSYTEEFDGAEVPSGFQRTDDDFPF